MKKTIYTVAFTLFACTVFAQVPGYVPTNGLQAFWSFSGNGNDSHGTNNLTNFNSTYTTDRFGVANAAGLFNGTTQYQICNSPTFTFGQTSTFTISYWVFRPVAGYGVALMHGTTVNNNFIWNFQTNTGTDIQFGTNKQGSAWSWAQSAYTINQWNHVVGTFNSGAMTLYVNGVQVATATYPHTGAIQGNFPIYFGRGVGGAYFNGRLDDVGIWNRVLTLSEIQLLYSGCDVTIANQPTDINGTLGSVVKFGVQTSGFGVNYRWQSNIGSGWVNVPASGQYSGVLTDSLTVSNLSMLNNNQQFRCLVSQGVDCGDTTDAVTLTVCGAITQQPLDSTIFINNSASFSVANSDASATHQWQTDLGSGFTNLVNGGQYLGANTNTITINNATMANHQQQFRCITTSATCIDTSDIAELNVINNVGIDDLQNNQIVSIYPNPAQDVLAVELGTVEKLSYVIFNMNGARVFNGEVHSSNNTIQIAHLAAGSYVLQTSNGQKILFVKEK